METIKDGGLLRSDFCTLPIKEEVKEITFEEVREYALNCGYELTESAVSGYELDNHNMIYYYPSLNEGMEVIKEGRLLRGESCDLPLPKEYAKFMGMDENKLCFELEDGDREYLARAIDLNYLKSHQSVIQDPNFTDHMKWESFNDLMGKVLAQI